MEIEQSIKWMNQALKLARQAFEIDEIPVGAVIVYEDEVIGMGYNQSICHNDPTSHAEIVAIRSACSASNNYRLPKNTFLYTTLEPCVMCVGAMIQARVDTLVYGAMSPNAGAIDSQLYLMKEDVFNHHFTVFSGILANESSALLEQFFLNKR